MWQVRGLGSRQERQHSRAACVLAVLLLHAALANWMLGLQQTRPAQALPTRMVLQMRTAQPAISQAVARPLPTRAQPPVHSPLHATQAKPRAAQPVSATPMASAHPAAPAVLSGTATATTTTSSVSPAATTSQATPESHVPAMTEAGFSADYLHNPAPVYPPSSRRNGEEGRVLLRVRVSAAGQAEAVDVQHGSGFSRLDDAAREAVANWRFTPARRGAQAIASTVIVPITFRLGH
ncbi:energy transducer TonB [Aquitalea sp. USM4]|uniref:energy transducer TonB n=1 Tax=Aquitalea sp. USM4 TaxID=1590041 RepID=UPI001F611DBD|nr:energy transducer TonB [Aquitalea sp. USM4]